MKGIEFKEWEKNAKKLKDHYKDFDELVKDSKKIFGREYCAVVNSDNYSYTKPVNVYVLGEPHIMRDIPIYYNTEKGLDRMIPEKLIGPIIEKLKDSVSIEKLLEDALLNLNPEDLTELFERAVTKNGKVNEKEGCYQLLVGGKSGRPFKLMLRN